MTETNILFHWQTHAKTICEGMSLMQQRDEFVDMTLAADGYHVKAHKMIISLASPYLKELIMSTDSQHPIIFLHEISYITLSYILEFVYSGQVMVKKIDLNNFVLACRSLQIKGLETKVLPVDSEHLISINPQQHIVNPKACEVNENNNNVSTVSGPNQFNPTAAEPTLSYPSLPEFKNPFPNVAEPTNPIPTVFEPKNLITSVAEPEIPIPTVLEHIQPIPTVGAMDHTSFVGGALEQPRDADDENFLDNLDMDISIQEILEDNLPAPQCFARKSPVQYSVSSRGSVQMIVNKYIYRLKYSGRCGQRTWQCVHAYGRNTRCKAQIHTNHALIVGRTEPHNHQNHGKEVLKKIEMGLMFNTLEEAQRYLTDDRE